MKMKSGLGREAAEKRAREVVVSGGVDFPIVGIGASAGGLEALEQFLHGVPASSGMAFVIVQHLDPTRKGLMPELLRRVTPMPVVQVRDRTRVQPDRVYVIPPNKDMSLLRGVLHLLEPKAARGLRLPIDFFLRSLALDRQERAVAVILSGMGSDGTLGLRDIKERAGVVLVQDPAEARFDGMPRSAIDAGLADMVAPAGDLAGKLIGHLGQPPLVARPAEVVDERMQSAVEKVVILLRAHTGHDFSLYKRSTLVRRIARRMGVHEIAGTSAYVRHLRENPQELDLLFKELLIGVTRFFRDPAMWETLRTEVLPALLATRSAGHALRAWIPGCSTGEEAYSLAMLFREVVERAAPRRDFALQIFATDLDRDSIDRARQAIFPAAIAGDVSAARLARFFTKEDPGYRVRKEIRAMVIFAPQNLIMDPPFTKLDILSCRNLLIYLSLEVQRKLMPLFHYSLVPGGVLILGGAETVGNHAGLFTPVRGASRIFLRAEPLLRTQPVDFPSSFSLLPPWQSTLPAAAKPAVSFQSVADELMLQRYVLPAVLVNPGGDILYVSGRTGRYLEPPAGKVNWNLFAMAREGFRNVLVDVFPRVLRQAEPVRMPGLCIGRGEGEGRVDITLERLEEPGPLHGVVLVLFADALTPPAEVKAGVGKAGERGVRLAELRQELERVRAEARLSRQEMQTGQEDLRSANEELQSTNEELQSTNEELTTSKEEMQSMNEELQTLNAELLAKVDELAQAGSDMRNLLDATDIATLFLDRDLNVRRYTAQVKTFLKLIPTDVGRPITDLVLDMDYPTLEADIRTVLATLIPVERSAGCRDGRWFGVRILPYRTLDERIDGVVITFADVTGSKRLETELRAQQAVLERKVAGHAESSVAAVAKADVKRRPRRRAPLSP